MCANTSADAKSTAASVILCRFAEKFSATFAL